MGRQPGGAAALLQPWLHIALGGQAVEPIGIQQQQASEILQLSFEGAAAQPGAIGHRIEALQGRLWLGQQHMGQHLPQLLGQGLWHHPFQPTNAAAAGGFQAQPRGTEVVAAAGKHPQPAPSVLGGSQRRLRPGALLLSRSELQRPKLASSPRLGKTDVGRLKGMRCCSPTQAMALSCQKPRFHSPTIKLRWQQAVPFRWAGLCRYQGRWGHRCSRSGHRCVGALAAIG